MTREELTDAQIEERFFKNKPGRPAKKTEAVDLDDKSIDTGKTAGALAQLRADTVNAEPAHLVADQASQAIAVARQIGYEGAMTVGALEDEIRFYQRRTVEAILETGKRLLVLKELTPHGEFTQRTELLGIHIKTAQRFMQAALKTAKNDKLSLLSTQVKNASAFLELVTHDDDVLDGLQEMDDFDRMSASELRNAVRELKAEKDASDQLVEVKNKAIDRLQRQLKQIEKLPPEEAEALVLKEAADIQAETQGMVRGHLRQALIALQNLPEDQTLFMAGMVGQVMSDLVALRDEFNLPEVGGKPEWEKWAEKTGAATGKAN